MAVRALPPLFALRTSRGALTAAIVLVVLAFGLAMGVYSSSGNAASGAVVSRLAQAAVDQVNSVASIFSGRSPGQRARGTLTNLKHKRSVALHERALPKIRPAPPASPLATILAPPPVAPAVVPPPVAPLYSAVTKGPVGVPVAQSVPTIFPAMSPPPGGGFIVPPIIGQVTPPVSPTVTPPPPQAPAVPEPSSWMMMLVGFGFIGWMLRRAGGSGLILN
jgi:hypothetical protein